YTSRTSINTCLPQRRRRRTRRRKTRSNGFRPLALAGFLARHLGAFLARLRQANRDRLLAALDRSAGATTLQRAVLALVHRPFDARLRFHAVSSGHDTLR